jgi:hydroxymethylpyrimidine pyrophosphatase-like HAD family hydrolase
MNAGAEANVLLSCSEILDRLALLPTPVGSADRLSHARAEVLDAYLYLSALEQIMADSLHRGLYNFSNIVPYLQHSRQLIEILTLRLPPRVAWLLDLLLRARLLPLAGTLLDGIAALRVKARTGLRERRATELWARLWDLQAELGEALARAAAGEAGPTDGGWLSSVIGQVVEAGAKLRPEVRRARLRLPSCFNMLDMLPEDCFRLGARLAEWVGDGPALCLGVRTSGSYLGPLVAGELRRLSAANVDYATARPHTPLLGPERQRIVAACRSGYRICIIDDPPQTGRALAAMTRGLLRAGARPGQIVCAFVATATQTQPGQPVAAQADGGWRNIWADTIADVPLVSVGPEQRRIVELLSEEAVGTSIADGCLDADRAPGTAKAPELVVLPEGSEATRGHQQRRLRVRRPEVTSGEASTVVAKGVGLGFLGRRAAAVAEQLQDWVPPVLALRDGIMVTEGPPDDAQNSCRKPTAAEVARYVADRAAALQMPEDPSLSVDDRTSGWHKLSAELCRGYHVLGPFHTERTARRLRGVFAPRHPAVIDACMQARNWERSADGSLRKRDFEEGPFGSNDVLLFDPVYDLAAAAYELDLSPDEWTCLLDAYREASGQKVGPGRWYVYQLLCGSQAMNSARIMLAGMRAAAVRRLDEAEVRELDATTHRAERFLSRATHRFLADVYGLDAAEADGSRVFAVDIDGVLGDGRAGFTSTTPAGALALRCLARHGWAVVLVTGRSLAEAAAWCEDLGLHGAVAEYGGVIWDARQREAADLRDPQERAAVDRARKTLAEHPGVFVEPTYEHGIRTYRWVGGARAPLTAEQLEKACRAAGDTTLREIPGMRQTDLVPEAADKSRGLRELLGLAGWRPREIWGIGDTAEDLAFLRLADTAWAPANAEPDVKRELRDRPNGHVSRTRQQAAVLQAAAAAACGQRGPCSACRVKIEDTESQTVVDLLAARNEPIWQAALGALNRGAAAMFRCERQ